LKSSRVSKLSGVILESFSLTARLTQLTSAGQIVPLAQLPHMIRYMSIYC